MVHATGLAEHKIKLRNGLAHLGWFGGSFEDEESSDRNKQTNKQL